LPEYRYPDHGTRDLDLILFVIDGVECYVSLEHLVEELGDLRIPGKEYPIGGCEDVTTLMYRILFFTLGWKKETVREIVTIPEIAAIGIKIGAREDPSFLNDGSTESSDGLPEEWKEMMKGIVSMEAAKVEPEVAEYKEVEINLFDIDLSKFEDSDDDSVQSSTYDDYKNNSESEEDLPYDRNLHTTNDEFISLYEDASRPEQEESEEFPDNESVTSENMPDNVLDPIEELAVDLIDPSRDNTNNPELRKISIVWDPGGKPRPAVSRVRRLAGFKIGPS